MFEGSTACCRGLHPCRNPNHVCEVCRGSYRRNQYHATPVSARTYLNVSFEEHKAAKALGAKWDPQRKQWYAPNSDVTVKCAQWLRKAAPAPVFNRAPPPVVEKKVGPVIATTMPTPAVTVKSPVATPVRSNLSFDELVALFRNSGSITGDVEQEKVMLPAQVRGDKLT